MLASDIGDGVNPRSRRRGAGVVDRDGLENRCTGNGTVGSNPTLSANFYRDNALRRQAAPLKTPVSARVTLQSC